MAELEISIFQRGCLSRRASSLGELRTRMNALVLERNAKPCSISWRFTCHDARNNLPDLYPHIKACLA
jgi:hypothetical protein